MPSERLLLARFSIVLAPRTDLPLPGWLLAPPEGPWGCYAVCFNEAGLTRTVAAEMAVNHFLDHLQGQTDVRALAPWAQVCVWSDEGVLLAPALTAARSRYPVSVSKIHPGLHGPERAPE